MIYLEETVPTRLLAMLSDVSQRLCEADEDVWLLFADRLEDIPGGDLVIGIDVLAKNGWDLVDWLPKPGLARHMGCAKLRMTR